MNNDRTKRRDSNTILVRDFNTPLSVMERTEDQYRNSTL